MNLKAIIVDDELNAIKMMEMILSKYCPQIEIVYKAQTPEKALKVIKETNFDILFLDIQMPKMNGFQLLKTLNEINFDVIFTTAFDQYAIEAFKINASNYLLKPVDPQDLKNAIENIVSQKQHEEKLLLSMLNEINNKNEFDEYRISIPFNKGIEFIYIKDIIYCNSENNYTHIFLSDGSERFIAKTLKTIENKLPEQIFYRPHNSFIVNLKYVSKYYRSDGGYLEMTNGAKIRIARNKKESILNLL